MTKTSLDVTTEALRMLGILSMDEAPEADDHARAKSHLEAIYAEIDESLGAAPEWTIETVPARLFLFVAQAVAGSIASGYELEQLAGLRRAGMAGIMRDEFGGKARQPTQASYL